VSEDADVHALWQPNHLACSVSTGGLRLVYARRRPVDEPA
jgi:hypothetical protein